MKRSEFKSHLSTLDTLRFFFQDGTPVPAHAHLTEAGIITRRFIDCGGQARQSSCTNLQLWVAEDVDHRLSPEKALRILTQFEQVFEPEDHEIEIEFESSTIGRYAPAPSPHGFVLHSTHTACLAPDSCGAPLVKERKALSSLSPASPVCKPGGTCC